METEKKERPALKKQSIHTSVLLKWIWHCYWPSLLLDEAFISEDDACKHVIWTLWQRRAGMVINSDCHFDWQTLWCQSGKENGVIGQAVSSSISVIRCQFKPIKLVWHILSAFFYLGRKCATFEILIWLTFWDDWRQLKVFSFSVFFVTAWHQIFCK